MHCCSYLRDEDTGLPHKREAMLRLSTRAGMYAETLMSTTQLTSVSRFKMVYTISKTEFWHIPHFNIFVCSGSGLARISQIW
jgi:hypothetical protein